MHLAIRQLSALYLTAASAYTVAMVLSHHPALADRAGEASILVRSSGAEVTAVVDNFVVQPAMRVVQAESISLTGKLTDASDVPPSKSAAEQLAERPGDPGLRATESESPVSSLASSSTNPSEPAGISSNSSARSNRSMTEQRVAQASSTTIQSAPDEALPQDDAAPDAVTSSPDLTPSTAEIAQVEQRLKDSLTAEMFDNFELFLYVSKAASGPWSQRMFVFQKEPGGDLALAHVWPVSTGREKVEYNAAGDKLPSFTPAGYYELDPHRFFSHYTSGEWGEPMPHAMFFNWVKDGEETGLAIHGASGDDVGQLGTRASAGCVRLPPDAARMLFTLIKSKYHGLAPRFAVDRSTGTMSNDGIILHDSDGKVQLANGYKVLVFIEDYGGENLVAAVY